MCESAMEAVDMTFRNLDGSEIGGVLGCRV